MIVKRVKYYWSSPSITVTAFGWTSNKTSGRAIKWIKNITNVKEGKTNPTES